MTDSTNQTVIGGKDPGVAPIYDKNSIAPHAKGSPPAQSPPDQFGHVPLKQGATPEPTDTIPAVAGTTLTQVPDPETLKAMARMGGGQHVPFGRQMNSAGGYDSPLIHDPQVFPRAEVPGTEGASRVAADANTTGTPVLSKSSVGSAPGQRIP